MDEKTVPPTPQSILACIVHITLKANNILFVQLLEIGYMFKICKLNIFLYNFLSPNCFSTSQERQKHMKMEQLQKLSDGTITEKYMDLILC